MLTFLEGRAQRLLATLTAAVLLAGLSVIGVLAPAEASPAGAQVIGGSSTWNLKDSFTSYLQNSAQSGAVITPALIDGQATYGAPSGTFDTETKTGTLTYPGSVHYSSPVGIDVTVSKVTVELSGEKATIWADFTGSEITDGSAKSVKISEPTVTWVDDSTFTLNGSFLEDITEVSEQFANWAYESISTFTSTIELAEAVATTTTVSASSAGSQLGSAVTFTATIAPEAAGTVRFFAGAQQIGADVPVTSGSAALTTTELALGTHLVTATFTPEDTWSFLGSTSDELSHDVTKVPVTETPGGETPGAENPTPVDPTVPGTSVSALAPGTYTNAIVNVSTVLPGGKVTVTGFGFGSGTTDIELAAYSVRQVLATGLKADANGTVSATVTLPTNLEAGVHTLSFEAPNGVISQVAITVQVSALAVTGPDSLGDAALLALAAVTIGLALVTVTRRRRSLVRIG